MDTTKTAAVRQEPQRDHVAARLLRRYRPLLREMAAYIVVGGLNTALFFIVYNVLRSQLSPFRANAVAVAIGAAANFYANRRFTFRIRGTEGLGLQMLQFAVAFGLTLVLSTGSLEILYRLDPEPSRLAENMALLVGTAVVVIARFIMLKAWVFGGDREGTPAGQDAATDVS